MLKTLKDLVFEDGNITREVLKSVAIEWIKALPVWCKCGAMAVLDYEGDIQCPVFKEEFDKTDKSENEYIKLLEKHKIKGCGSWQDLGKVEWIKHFFNISEEDLR